KRTSGTVATRFGTLQAEASTEWLMTFAARFGYAADCSLIFGRGGVGWVGDKVTVSNLTTQLLVSGTNSKAGFVLGAGWEYAFTSNWTAKIEYDHIFLGTWTPGSTIAGDQISARREINMVTGGFNYKFDNIW